MITRREFLGLAAGTGVATLLPGCASSPHLPRERFTNFGDAATPYLGMATSLHDELDYEARIEGKLPPELMGTLYRNGPALFERDGLRKRTFLDGDGMVHAFYFHGSGVRFRNRFVRTRKFTEEEKAGRYLYPTWSTQAPGGFWANLLPGDLMLSQAAVNVFHFNGRLYAFDESLPPYEMDPETLATIGESRLGVPGNIEVAFSAHPKLDPETGQWLHFGLQYGPRPKLHVTVFRRDGRLEHHRTVPFERYLYMHDWFASRRHMVIVFQPVEIGIWGFLFGLRSISDSLAWRPEWGNALMIMERGSDAPPLRIETDPCFIWHGANAYEEGNELVLNFVGYDRPDHFVGKNRMVAAIMEGREGAFRHPGTLRRYRVDLGKRTVRTETLVNGNFEWPRFDNRLLGRSNRFLYLCAGRPDRFFWTRLRRVDMLTGNSWEYGFDEGMYCTEPVFVPLPASNPDPALPVESGWLLSEVYNSRTRRNFLAVFEASRLEEGPVAVVHLTHHVPYSYHGWWREG